LKARERSDEEESVQRRADHRGFEAARVRGEDGGSLPGARRTATFYQWKSKFGGMDVTEAQRLRALEDENRRLKMLVAELSLGGEALKAVIRKNGWSFHPTG
jgi:hypothetical protein